MSSFSADPRSAYGLKQWMCMGALDAWIDIQGIVDDSDSASKKVHFFLYEK